MMTNSSSAVQRLIRHTISKLQKENDFLRRELTTQKERCHNLIEERVSLKLVVQILSKDLYHK